MVRFSRIIAGAAHNARLKQAATQSLPPDTFAGRETGEVEMASAGGARVGHILVIMALVCASSTLASAQVSRLPRVTMPIEEQPGYEPDPSAEQLPAAYRRQLVFYRTTEVPGTIIVHTSERFLYLVQGKTGRCATASASAATASSGRACSRSRARPSGRTGVRRPR